MKFKATSFKKMLVAFLSTSFIIAMAPGIPVVKAESVTEFFASFETSESSQALSNQVVDSKNMTAAMSTAPAAGPNSTADPIYGRAWDGTRVMRVTGTQPAGGDAYSTNLIYDNLAIEVKPDTQLSYVMLPDYTSAASATMSVANWDWDFTSQYISLDLEFEDGSRLSTLGGVDQYGHPMTGRGQGDGKHLYQKQWNLVRSNVGEVAAGKTIKKIFVCFDKPVNKREASRTFGAYIDYLRIREVDTSPKATPVEYANIFVGNSDRPLYSRGNQWPSLMTPNGFNVWCPSNVPLREYLGGYDYASEKIFAPIPSAGITHITVSHQASCWIGDFGVFQFMPNTNYAQSNSSVITPANRRTLYNRDEMIANPSYFSVQFSNADNAPAKGVKLELTPTEHAAMARMTFPADSQYVNVVFDSMSMGSNQSTINTVGGSMTISGNTFSARTTRNVSEGRSSDMYIYGEFDKTPSEAKAYSATANAKAMFTFPTGTTEVNLKLATSFISADQAKKNLQLEIPEDATFDEVKEATAKTWNDVLGVVEVEGASEEEKVALYSSIMRTYADPLLLSENTGTADEPVWKYSSPYTGTNGSTRVATTGYKLYYNNGFWDTFRGAWATYQLMTPVKANEMLDGLVQHYIDSNWIARWLAPGGRNSMVGTSSDIILGDAIAKGISEFDYQNAYMASLKNASTFSSTSGSASPVTSSYAGRAGMATAPFLGYTSSNENSKGLSWSIDNYLNDLGVSVLAEKLGKTDEAIYFRNSAQNFVNLWNYSGGGWFIGKTNVGAWQYPNGMTFNTSGNDSAYRKADPYEETNAFTMTFSGSADMHGLTNLYGGKEKLAERLDRLFTDETLFNGIGRDMFVDFYDTKMGQYGHGNQPNFHIPYVYTYAGQPYKTQKITREILDRVYVGASFDQLFPGDQDNGSTSGWYVMSALGLYPFSSGMDGYILTSPKYDKTTLNLPTGKVEIICNNNSHDNVYIQSMTIDGVPYNEVYLKHSDLLKAKKIVFEMGPNPSDWACDSVPPSITPADSDEVPNPLKDFTTSGVAIANAIPENNHTAEAAYVTNMTTSNAAYLFNNTSAQNAPFTAADGSVYYYFMNAKKVEMVTLTSASALGDSAPDSFALYGSNDGAEWSLLDSRTEIAFDWARQLKPFAINNDTAYYYYRLDLKADANIQLAEIELSGYPVNIVSVSNILSEKPYTFKVVTENSVGSVWLRDSDFNRISDAAISTAVINADGTKTFTVTLNGALKNMYYITAANSSGYEITSSRKTFKINSDFKIYMDGLNNVRADYFNGTDQTVEFKYMLIAAYDMNGNLVKIETQKDIVIDAYTFNTISLDAASLAGCTFKAFIWDDNYVPVCDPITLE